MYKKILLVALTGLLMLSSCRTSYKVAAIERSRVLIDSRYDARPDAEAAAFLAPYKHVVDSVMSPVVGSVARDLATNRPEGLLSNLLPDVLVWAGKDFNEQPDLAVYNIGGMRASFAQGKVTYGDVVEVAPFENKICFLTLTGEQLLELFGQIAHRGGEGVSHGVELVITKKGELKSARLHGKEIVPDARYRIATLDYLAQGNDEMRAFQKGVDVVSPQTEENNVRYIIMNYFLEQTKQGRTVDAQLEGRIKVSE